MASDSDGRSSQQSFLNDLHELDNFFKEDYDYDGEEPQEPPRYPHLVHKPGTYIQELYLRACRQLQIPHSSFFYKSLTGDKIVLKRQHLGPIGMKACAIALVETLSVHTLDLTDNNLGPEGAKYLAELIAENQFIKHLNLSSNVFGFDGVHALAEVIKKTDSILTLNISDNLIGDRQAEAVRPIIEDTNNLKSLNLSHNELGDVGGKIIGDALIWSDTIKHLDLSWNHLRRKGAVKFAESLVKNTSLTSLNLSYNGLYMPGIAALAKVLEKNVTLTELDISNNRVDRSCLDRLCTSLRKNSTLEILRMGQNPLKYEDTIAILTFVRDNPSSGLRYIDLREISVEESFLHLADELRVAREMTVKHGKLRGSEMQIHDLDEGLLLKEESGAVLEELSYVLGVNIEKIFRDISEQLHAFLTPDQIVNGLKILQNPLSEKCTQILIKRMDRDGGGFIDFSSKQKSEKKKQQACLGRRMSFIEALRETENNADNTETTAGNTENNASNSEATAEDDDDHDAKEEKTEDVSERIRRYLFNVMTRRMCGSTAYRRNVGNMSQDGETMLKYRIIEELLESREEISLNTQRKPSSAPCGSLK